jgi:hypothetical protein
MRGEKALSLHCQDLPPSDFCREQAFLVSRFAVRAQRDAGASVPPFRLQPPIFKTNFAFALGCPKNSQTKQSPHILEGWQPSHAGLPTPRRIRSAPSLNQPLRLVAGTMGFRPVCQSNANALSVHNSTRSPVVWSPERSLNCIVNSRAIAMSLNP